MSGPRDDDLREMLEARADRMPSAVSDEILASVRDKPWGRGRGAAFSVLRVASGIRGPAVPAGWAAIGLVAVLALAVLGGRLDSGPARPSAVGGASASPSVTSGPSAAPPTEAAASPASVTTDQLRAGLATGALEGRTVLVTGRLKMLAWPCPYPVPDDCYGLELQGLAGVELAHAGLMTMDEARATIDGDHADRLLAFRVNGGQLVLLGWITKGVERPVNVAELLRGTPPGRAELAAASGSLEPVRGADCPSPSDRCTGRWPVLVETVADGGPQAVDAIDVTVDESAGFWSGSSALAGPFLLRFMAYRGGDRPSWNVAARLDPANTLSLGTIDASTADGSPSPPPSPSSTAGPVGPLSAAELRVGLENGSLAGHLVLLDGALSPVPLPFPPPAGSDDVGITLHGLDGVAISWDGPLSSTDAWDMSGTLAFVVRDGGLVFLGRVEGDIGAPTTVARLLAGPGGVGRPFSLAVVSGWLVVGGIHTSPLLPPGATPYPGPGPWLTDEKPFPEGILASSEGTSVATLGLPVGRPAGQIVTPGPFLVRRVVIGSTCDALPRASGFTCAGGPILGWQVVAVIDPDVTVRAVVP